MRILFFISIGVLGLFAPWWGVLVGVALYSYRYFAPELIFWGLLFDVSFGQHTGSVPIPFLYSASFFAIMYLLHLVRPYMRSRTG